MHQTCGPGIYRGSEFYCKTINNGNKLIRAVVKYWEGVVKNVDRQGGAASVDPIFHVDRYSVADLMQYFFFPSLFFDNIYWIKIPIKPTRGKVLNYIMIIETVLKLELFWFLISKLRFFVIPYVLIGVGNDLIDKSLHFVCKIDRLKFKYATDCAGHLNAKFEARPYLQTQTRPNG